jgi:hypothetical protein
MGKQDDKPGLRNTRLDAGRKPTESLVGYWVRIGAIECARQCD